jgi:hypothetical protein
MENLAIETGHYFVLKSLEGWQAMRKSLEERGEQGFTQVSRPA